MDRRRLRLLSANIQAGSSTRGYQDYVTRSWSHVLPAGNKRGALDAIAALAGEHDIVGATHLIAEDFRSVTDLTVFVLPGAGHNHNVAPTRQLLWDRIDRWARTVLGLSLE